MAIFWQDTEFMRKEVHTNLGQTQVKKGYRLPEDDMVVPKQFLVGDDDD